jgi:hypothetical protein
MDELTCWTKEADKVIVSRAGLLAVIQADAPMAAGRVRTRVQPTERANSCCALRAVRVTSPRKHFPDLALAVPT